MGINKDQVAGRAKEIVGATKETIGKAVGNDKLANKGQAEKVTGIVQATVGDIKKEVGDIVKPA
jgi:uncharacterized protein YjbJ (UPF0337 family)